MQHIFKLIAVAAFAITAAGFTSEADAQFRVRLDNFATDDAVSWAHTASDVEVCVQFDETSFWWFFGCVPLAATRPLTTHTNHDYNWTDVEDVNQIEYIDVKIHGNDMFFLDQFEIFVGNNRVFVSGVDNTQGWCLSTDPSDGNVTHCTPDDSTLTKRFTP